MNTATAPYWEHKPDWLKSTAANEPWWEEEPAWATYRAMDENGVWLVFDAKPTPSDYGWLGDWVKSQPAKKQPAKNGRYWKTTVEHRHD